MILYILSSLNLSNIPMINGKASMFNRWLRSQMNSEIVAHAIKVNHGHGALATFVIPTPQIVASKKAKKRTKIYELLIILLRPYDEYVTKLPNINNNEIIMNGIVSLSFNFILFCLL